MKLRTEYRVTVERWIPKRLLRGLTDDEKWDYLMSVYRDVLEAFPGAGVTVTQCRCHPMRCPCDPVLSVTGTDESKARQIVETSEIKHRHW